MSVVRIRRKGGVVVQGCDVYIGRRMTQGGWDLPASIFANPFKVINGDVDGAVVAYYQWLVAQPHILEHIPTLRGKVLGCWCKNRPNDLCHGDVLVWLANELESVLFIHNTMRNARVIAEWCLALREHYDTRWRAEIQHPLDVYNPHIGALADDLHVRFLIDSNENLRGIIRHMPRGHIEWQAILLHKSRFKTRKSIYCERPKLYSTDARHVTPCPASESRAIAWLNDIKRSAWITPVVMTEIREAAYRCRCDVVAIIGTILHGPLNRSPPVRDELLDRAYWWRYELHREATVIADWITRDPALIVISYTRESAKPPYPFAIR